jgi:hypothetical protein
MLSDEDHEEEEEEEEGGVADRINKDPVPVDAAALLDGATTTERGLKPFVFDTIAVANHRRSALLPNRRIVVTWGVCSVG